MHALYDLYLLSLFLSLSVSVSLNLSLSHTLSLYLLSLMHLQIHNLFTKNTAFFTQGYRYNICIIPIHYILDSLVILHSRLLMYGPKKL